MNTLQNIHLTFKCPKTLDELTPCNSNWYCAGCSRMIMDFRGMEEAEILGLLRNDNKMHCGIFDAGTINYVPQPKWQRWLSAAFIALGLTAVSNMVLAQQKSSIKKVHTAKPAKKKAVAADDGALVGVMAIAWVPPGYADGLPAFYDYIKKNLNGVAVTETKNTLIKFTIDRNALITNVDVPEAGDVNIDQQIIELIKKSNRWIPSISNGHPIPASFNCYVTVTAPGSVDIKLEGVPQ